MNNSAYEGNGVSWRPNMVIFNGFNPESSTNELMSYSRLRDVFRCYHTLAVDTEIDNFNPFVLTFRFEYTPGSMDVSIRPTVAGIPVRLSLLLVLPF